MALITPEQLIVYLDLPGDTAPTDRAQLVCDLVIDAVARIAGGMLTAPYPTGVLGVALTAAGRLYDNPTGLRAAAVDDYSQTYSGAPLSVLNEAEQAELRRTFGTGGTAPKYQFPAWDWSWTSTPASRLTD